MRNARLLVHAAAVVGLCAGMVLPAAAHAGNGHFETKAEMGWHLGSFGNDWARELAAFRSRVKIQKKEKKEDRRYKNAATTNAEPICVRNATDKREGALLTTHDSLSASLRNALVVRKNALYSAWSVTVSTDRESALRNAWDAYATAVKTAHTTYRTQHNAAWATFTADVAACPAVSS